MNNYIVWLDSKEASVFALKTSGTEKSHIKKSEMDHHRMNKKDMHTDNNAEHYYHDLTALVKDADQLLLFGPGLTKDHFKKYLESHAEPLSKKIIGVEPLERLTENQILAAGHKFFKQLGVFNNPI